MRAIFVHYGTVHEGYAIAAVSAEPAIVKGDAKGRNLSAVLGTVQQIALFNKELIETVGNQAIRGSAQLHIGEAQYAMDDLDLTVMATNQMDHGSAAVMDDGQFFQSDIGGIGDVDKDCISGGAGIVQDRHVAASADDSRALADDELAGAVYVDGSGGKVDGAARSDLLLKSTCSVNVATGTANTEKEQGKNEVLHS